MENFKFGKPEIPEEPEERVIIAPIGSPVGPLIRRALSNYKRSGYESGVKYYVQVGDIKMLVKENDSEEDAQKRYDSLLEGR